MRGLLQALGAIWRLAYPYFVTRDMTEVHLWPFGRFRVQERWVALVMAAVVIGIEFGQVAINVRLSYFSRDWFNAIQNKDAASFWTLLLTVFCFWAAVYIASGVYQYAIQSYLSIRWRRWMTQRYISRWLDGNVHYLMQLLGPATDNPDQRIAEDIDAFITRTQTLTLGLISAVSTLASFSVVLWQLSADFTVPGTDLIIPGFLLWGALIYTAIATWLTHLIGRPLIGLNFAQQRYEADFRFSLARLREYGEQVALLEGDRAEKEQLGTRFGSVIGNFLQIVSRRKKLLVFTVGYSQVNVVVPYVLVAPYYFVGKITLGGMQQTAGAFARVEGTMSFFISQYASIAEYKAVVDRLTTFEASARRADDLKSGRRLSISREARPNIAFENLTLSLPDGRQLADIDGVSLKAGESTLIVGPSGSGKSTLFRTIAGIWPFGSGTVIEPKDTRLMLLPQRPYIPVGTLRGAVTYPALASSYDDAAISDALAKAHLPQFSGRLDEEALWGQTLSLGEQQRLAIARAILAKPDWLFLDEATAALDEPTEAAVYAALATALPNTTVVSIGHRSTLAAFHKRRIEMQHADEAPTPLAAE